jgi:hypothetical protein
MSRRFWSLLAVVCACLAATDARAVVVPQPPHCRALHGQPPCSADVAVSVTPPAGTVYVGEDVVFTVTVTNGGPRAAVGAISLQSSQRGVRITPPGHFNYGPLPPGQQTAQFHLRPVAVGQLTLQATAGGLNALPDPNPANDVATASINAVIGRCTSAMSGTAGDDRIFGTIGGELVNALGGDDLIRTGDGDDCVNGGPGNDTIAGGAGNDLLKGRGGADTISGGSGRDDISGGAGADRINAADGWRDTISCGLGTDALKADKFDRFHGCEHVRIV